MTYLKNHTIKNKNNSIKRNNISRKTRIKNTPPFPIDVVYTWAGEQMSDNIRVSYNYELKYSIRSVDLYAPWVNKIYILMNPPKKLPSWIDEEKNTKIVIVEHTETFPFLSYLPNTNSNAIETTIANIKDLSEHYIYFNDDFFIGRPTKYTDFFTADGKAIIDSKTTYKNTILKSNSKNILNIKFPPNGIKLYRHMPISLIKSLVLAFNKKYSDYINWIRNTKKRNNKGYDICEKYNLNSPCQQIHYPICKYMYSKGKAVLKDNTDRILYAENGNINFHGELNKILYLKPLFFCINDTQKESVARKNARIALLRFFKMYYPKKPNYEK
jgi:hypothetical protein